MKRKQSEASDPGVSAWVAANAGSGKTYVLAQRVINLLLNGVAPEKILCITFTKAAAANMAKRVFDTLAEWTTLDDGKLDKAIRDSARHVARRARRALARRLFARALETPGGLKVQTIHAFCTQLLHQFPFEANVAARFSVLDEAEQTQLLERLTLNVLLDGARRSRQRAWPRARYRHDRGGRPDLPRRGARSDRQARRDHALGEKAGSVEAAIADLSRNARRRSVRRRSRASKRSILPAR